MLLIYLFVSMKLENGHKILFGSSFKIMLHCVILRNRLKYYTERWFKEKTKYYSLGKNAFSRLILFKDNIYNVNWTSAQSFSYKFII